jgi:hypothetical protein
MKLAEEWNNFHNAVRGVIEEMVSELPSGTANLVVKNIGNDEVLITVEPANPEAAKISVHLDRASLIDFHFGEFGGTWELPDEGISKQKSKESLLQGVKQFTQAVIQGKCEERIGLISTSGILWIDEQPHHVTNFLDFHPLRFWSKRRRHYQPYA